MVLRLRTQAPRWEKGKCYGNPPGPEDDVFFDNSEDGYEDQTEEGVEFCNGTVDGEVCGIREECMLFALVNNCREGVWGGLNENDRKMMRKIWKWPGGAEPHPEWRWRSREELQALYNALPPRAKEEEDSDDEPETE